MSDLGVFRQVWVVECACCKERMEAQTRPELEEALRDEEWGKKWEKSGVHGWMCGDCFSFEKDDLEVIYA